MVRAVKSSQSSLLIIYGTIVQASEAVSYTMRREGAGVKQVRRVGQSETIGNVHKALQHVMLAPGDNLFK